MNEKINYISDEELERLIFSVENKELVSAPPDLAGNILETCGLLPKLAEARPKTSKKKEFYAYCFRVLTSVAAAVALVFLLPQMTDLVEQKALSEFITPAYGQEIPAYEDVVAPVPKKEDVVAVKTALSKEEVLNDTGLVERFIRNTGWFNKNSNKQRNTK